MPATSSLKLWLRDLIFRHQARQTGQGVYAVTARDATSFTISFANQPGASTWEFDWRAQIYES
jgi:hypothetical protein